MTPGPDVATTSDLSQRWLRGVVLFLSGQTVSLLGSSIVGYAVIWYLTLTTGSGTIYALAMVASQLTQGLICLPGGVWADRHWRKPLIIGADVGVATVTTALAVLYLTGHQQLWLIVLLLGLRGLGAGVQSPAVGATLPQLTPVRHLMRVNSINASVQAAMFVAAPALAAVLLTWVSLGWILLLDVCTALIGVGFTLAVRIPRLPRTVDAAAAEHRGARAYTHELRTAWDGVRHHAGLMRVMVLYAAMSTLVFPLAMLTPVFVVRLFGDEQWMLAAVEITWSVGMVVGGLVMAAWGGPRNRMTLVVAACGAWCLSAAAMGVSPNVWVFCVVMVVFGGSVPFGNTAAVTALQENVPPALLGRIMGIVTVILAISGPVGIAVYGPLADHVSLRVLCLVAAVLGAAFVVVTHRRAGPGSVLLAPQPADATPQLQH